MVKASAYVLFAIVSTLLNLGVQHIVFATLGEGAYVIYVALFCGTLAGLVVKYVLDKIYIFEYRTKSKSDDLTKFFLYSSMGVFTTIIFWAFELSFNYCFEFAYAKYVGAVIGLTIGYVAKYFLDKRFVFAS